MAEQVITQKEIATDCLKKLDIYKPYIAKFKRSSVPTFFEQCIGFYADQEEALWKQIKKVEEEYGYTVYAITHEAFEFGKCWSMLCVFDEAECVEDCITEISPDTFYAFAYVYNEDYPELSEAGDIVVRSAVGGIKRIG